MCLELRNSYSKIYLQLLHYNVFDYLSKKLNEKFRYKLALEEY